MRHGMRTLSPKGQTKHGMTHDPRNHGNEAMTTQLPKLYLARHGDTAWTDAHKHTGRTDVPLNASGEEHARQLGEAPPPVTFPHVFMSPLQRATKTCALAGYADGAIINLDLLEWDYGLYEGRVTSDIVKQ